MSLELIKHNAEELLEVIDSYTVLLDKRGEEMDVDKIKEIDEKIEEVKKHISRLNLEIRDNVVEEENKLK